MSTAWKLGQLGQLGLALLGDGEEGLEGVDDDELEQQPFGLAELLDATHRSPPPLSERLLAPASSDERADDNASSTDGNVL